MRSATSARYHKVWKQSKSGITRCLRDYNTCSTLYWHGVECWGSWGNFAISCLSFSSLWLSNYVTWVLRILAKERFWRMILRGEVLAAPAIMRHKQSNSLWISLLFSRRAGILTPLKTGAAYVFLLSALLWTVQLISVFLGVWENNRMIEIFWLHGGTGLWCSACYIASYTMVSLVCDEQTAKTALRVGRHSQISCTWF